METGHVFPLLYISSSFGWVRPGSDVLPFRIRSFGFLLERSVPVGSVQPWVAVPCGEPICVYSHIAVQFPADSDVYF